MVSLRLGYVAIRRPCDLVDVLSIKEGRPNFHTVHGTELGESIPVVSAITKSMWIKDVFKSRSASSNLSIQVSHDDENVMARDLADHILELLVEGILISIIAFVRWGIALHYADLCVGCDESCGHETFIDRCPFFKGAVSKLVHNKGCPIPMDSILTT